MGFHINVYNMPRIGDYKHAKEIFNNRTAVRGESQSLRRLGDRYEKEKWIRKEMLDGIEVYVAGYYDTALVAFYPTHKEITLGGYPSTSTQYFVHRISGVYLQPFEHKKYVPSPYTKHPMVKNNQIECFIGGGYHMNANDWYKLDYNNEPLDPNQFEKPVKYRFDASQMRALRKPYKKLLKYADTILKLSDEGVANDEKLSQEVNQYPNKLELFADEDKTYLSFYHLLRQCQDIRWTGNYPNHKEVTYCNIGRIKRYMDKMIKLENPQILVEVKPTNNLTSE
jgi:hypothetical protein